MDARTCKVSVQNWLETHGEVSTCSGSSLDAVGASGWVRTAKGMQLELSSSVEAGTTWSVILITRGLALPVSRTITG